MVSFEAKGTSVFRIFSSRGAILKFFESVNLTWLESYIFGTSKKYIDPGFWWTFLDELHSRNLTWQWTIIHFDGIYQERWGESPLSCWFSVFFLTTRVFRRFPSSKETTSVEHSTTVEAEVGMADFHGISR